MERTSLSSVYEVNHNDASLPPIFNGFKLYVNSLRFNIIISCS